ncbi:hypothetical protein AMTRI_Chr03g146000 [Amborella trichopoda]
MDGVDLTKVPAFIHVIDDIYDIHGTLDELHQFTDAIKRLSKRPLKVFNNHGLNIMGHLRLAVLFFSNPFLLSFLS